MSVIDCSKLRKRKNYKRWSATTCGYKHVKTGEICGAYCWSRKEQELALCEVHIGFPTKSRKTKKKEETKTMQKNLPAKQEKKAALAKPQKAASLFNVGRADEELGRNPNHYSVNKDSGKIITPYGEVDVVPSVWLGMSMYRIWSPPFRPGSDKQDKAFCFAPNGETPTHGTNIQSNPCSVCPMARWNGTEKPACSKVFRLLLWDANSKQCFFFDVKRTGIKSLRAYKTYLLNISSIAAYENVDVRHCVETKLSGVKEKNSYFVPRFEMGNRLPEQSANEFSFYAAMEMGKINEGDEEEDQEVEEKPAPEKIPEVKNDLFEGEEAPEGSHYEEESKVG